MWDANNLECRRSLSEAIAWCTALPLVGETEEHSRKRRRLDEAGRIRAIGYRIEENLPAGKILAKPYYRQAEKLARNVRIDSMVEFGTQLRSDILRPRALADGRETERNEIVTDLVDKRRELLPGGPLAKSPCFEDTGRLLVYFPSKNLADGAAQVMSNGFFDVDNAPPWDTWVHYSDGTLVSWVPPALISLAQAGINVNPEECIRWAA